MSTIITKVVTRETLKTNVQKAMTKVPEGTMFVAGVRKIKDYAGTHQMMLEVVQLKDLKAAGRKESIVSNLNTGDTRFSASLRTIRVWLKMTIEGYEKTFPQLAEQISGEELHKQVGTLGEDDVLSIFTLFDKIALLDGSLVRPTIAVKQYSDRHATDFPSRIAKILDTVEKDRTPRQDEDLKGLTMRSKDQELLVDGFGNQVYELTELTYGEEDNRTVSKMPVSEYVKLTSGIKAVAKAGLGQILDLVE